MHRLEFMSENYYDGWNGSYKCNLNIDIHAQFRRSSACLRKYFVRQHFGWQHRRGENHSGKLIFNKNGPRRQLHGLFTIQLVKKSHLPPLYWTISFLLEVLLKNQVKSLQRLVKKAPNCYLQPDCKIYKHKMMELRWDFYSLIKNIWKLILVFHLQNNLWSCILKAIENLKDHSFLFAFFFSFVFMNVTNQ